MEHHETTQSYVYWYNYGPVPTTYPGPTKSPGAGSHDGFNDGGVVFRSGGNGRWGWDGEDGGSSDRRWEILNGDIGEGDMNDRIFELSMSIFVLFLSRPLKDWAVEGL